VDVAVRLAADRGNRLTLLVVPSHSAPRDRSLRGYIEQEASARESAHATARLAEQRAEAQQPRLRVERLVTDLDGLGLTGLAERATLLVIGSYGADGQRAMSMGSTGPAMVRELRCPVLVPRERGVRHPAVPQHARVVVGVDGRGGEEELIGIAAAEARARGLSLVIVRAVPAGEVGGGIGRPDVWDETWMAVRHAEHTGSVSSRVVVGVGDAVAVLTGECGPDDVLVVGTRGLTRLSGLVSGSVTRAVLDVGECDVLVVPPCARAHALSAVAAAV
jgi:nucleotide-binding universal stress UspA family protein